MTVDGPFRLAAATLCAAALIAPGTAQAQQDPVAPVDATGEQAVVPTFSSDIAPEPDLSFDPGDRRDRTLIFSALLGAQSEPSYFGASDTEIVPDFRINFAVLNFEGLRIGDDLEVPNDPNARRRGFGVGGSFRYVSGRDADEFDEIRGLDDIDPSIELGIGIGFAWPQAEAFADLRYGVSGHESWVGELGANYVMRPSDRLALRVGPRLLYGGDNYADTYFGVSSSEASASGLDAYEAEGGLMRAGVELVATYQLSERWWLEGRARYDRLQDSAADSPITRSGSDDQSTLSIGVRRAFVLDF